MPPFKVTAVDHVDITTPTELEAEVLAWYIDVLGLQRIEKPEGTRPGGAWFQVGDAQVHVTDDEHNPPKQAHFCLVVDDLDATIEHLRANGCHMEQAGPIPGIRRFYTRDPAGNRIELMSHTTDKGSAG